LYKALVRKGPEISLQAPSMPFTVLYAECFDTVMVEVYTLKYTLRGAI